METELDTESESESDDDTINIYEEYLNKENCQRRHLPSLLSNNSSHNSAGGWRYPASRYNQKVSKRVKVKTFNILFLIFQNLQSDSILRTFAPKKQLFRTTKSNPISSQIFRTDSNYKDSWINTKNTRDTEETQFKTVKKSLSEKLSNLRVNKATKKADIRKSGHY